MEAYAQTAETIGAVTKTAEWYTGQAGVAAGTLMIVCFGLLGLVALLFRRLEKRDGDITELKVACAKEIADAKIEANADAQRQSTMAWDRVNQIYGSVNALFSKCDSSNEKVADALGKLTTVMATKGVFARD